jgi:transposase
MSRYTFLEFQQDYPTDEACLDKIMALKFGESPTCPGCGRGSKFHRITKRRAYACQHCGHHIYPCVGTPFEKSRTSLQKWFFAMYLFTASKNGVSAKELERQLGVTYKTAWRMAHELRKLMANADDHGPLSGHVELDETYVGGRKRGKRGRGSENKTVVFGMVERDGTLRAGPVPNAKRITLQPIIAKNIQRGSIISTDEMSAYKSLTKFGYRHGAVNHSWEEWARYDKRTDALIHTNTLEGYWSQLKRSIRGTHVHVSRKHLWKYVSEFSYRYNMRKEDTATIFRDILLTLQQPHLKAG